MEPRDAEVERIAAAMIRDGIGGDEQDAARLAPYEAMADAGAGDPRELVLEALLYIKMKESEPGDILGNAGKFGAGFS
ncbi:MAG: hypothetical protein MPI95_06020 [Nitrosopumilus sp.]|nr:hypothetical protein [Nitrosopumilus sp.]MDA7941511.1 hypothetical protein [Nitrosopumilus sp.]MDA7943347.1 hypothetical protein [Nitrosopumilus sp.]MDA7944795.1 hypothetical protein [Nitrosopumilus sp.]MDA7952939.1 hypothetical protein [Nitrosopumilus sp.]